MRITPQQISIIVQTTRSIAGQDADVWLYGSRVSDSRRGGDVDLLIESAQAVTVLQRARIKVELEQALQLPFDVLATGRDTQDTPFVCIARANAVCLSKHPASAGLQSSSA